MCQGGGSGVLDWRRNAELEVGEGKVLMLKQQKKEQRTLAGKARRRHHN